MTKTKYKKLISVILALALAVGMCGLLFTRSKAMTARAQSDYFWLRYNYTKYDVKDNGTRKKVDAWDNTYGGSIKSAPYTTTTLGLKCYKSDFDLNKWMYSYNLEPKEGLNFGDISLAVSGGFPEWEITTYDSTGRKMGSSKNTPLTLNYPEGHYTLKFTAKANHYNSSDGGGYYLVEADSAFNVDHTAPSIVGADPEGQERWVTVGHTVRAIDAVSEIKFFYKSNEKGQLAGYNYETDSYTFKEGDKNGHYSFYCVDWSTNKSEKKWLYFDGVKPTGVISTADGEVESGSTVNKAFSFTAEDDYSGIEKLEYKQPGSSSWQPYSDGHEIAANSKGGEYFFRCVDKAGNENVYSVILESAGGSTEGGSDHGSGDGDDEGGGGGSDHGNGDGTDEGGGSGSDHGNGDGTDEGGGSGSDHGNGDRGDEGGDSGSDHGNGDGGDEGGDSGDDHGNGDGGDEGGDSGDDHGNGGDTDEGGGSGDDHESGDEGNEGGDSGGDHGSGDGGDEGDTGDHGSGDGGSDGGGDGDSGDHDGGEAGGGTTDPEQPAPPAHTTHSYEKQSEKEATCTEDGYIEYACSECGTTYRTTKPKLGHRYTTSKKTTCTGETTIYTCSRCGDSYSESTGEGIGHSYVATTTPATCTGKGYTTYRCSRCGDTYKGNETAALGHNLSSSRTIDCTRETIVYSCSRCSYSLTSVGEGYGHNYVASITEPTCTTGGYTIFRCSNCGDSYRGNDTKPLGHNYIEKRQTTCTGETTVYTCTRCSYSYADETGNGEGHNYVASITEPTCTVGGFTVYKCTRCGVSYQDNVTKPLGHSYTVVQNATCTSGTIIYTCTRCGERKVESTGEGTGHNYVASIIAPTCTEGGYTIYRCTRCGNEYRDNETPALEHNYVSSVVPATCETGGYTNHECSRCKDSYRDNESQPLGHNFLTTTKLPTCTEYGKTVYTCQVCGFVKEENDGTYPTGHSYTNIIVEAATCTENGIRKSVCDLCGEVKEHVISALGHQYEITASETIGDNTVRTYTCSVCGDSYTQELGDQYESVSNYVEYLFEQYAPYMYWVLLATAGLWSIAIGVAIIIAVKNEDKAKAKKMLVNYVIGLVIIFAIVVACPYLVRGIAALVT